MPLSGRCAGKSLLSGFLWYRCRRRSAELPSKSVPETTTRSRGSPTPAGPAIGRQGRQHSRFCLHSWRPLFSYPRRSRHRHHGHMRSGREDAVQDLEIDAVTTSVRSALLALKCEIAARRVVLAAEKLASLLRKAGFNADQPRDDRGRWTDTGAGDVNVNDDTGDDLQLLLIGGPGSRSGYPVDILDEASLGGHTHTEHVGKSDEYLRVGLSAAGPALPEYCPLGCGVQVHSRRLKPLTNLSTRPWPRIEARLKNSSWEASRRLYHSNSCWPTSIVRPATKRMHPTTGPSRT